ncbi:BZ3500_MvSof-1268-A1-R1_Chr3-2g06270 [Microbotryum saponariae]|uniref:BZ3500_MvSof-1268-A1-R1_Chr3-2g06270 protein n=1 Tax=Microbotryum saponariae TaxID=289078 RepID=A0A2X0LBL2_9BASI|nr:BZ3500_MvSof-1268-A1-R1_Chr3-2g06270 [Microbotryum saponariae]SDA04241.1 BZ3501_MvSof-1269-A2-R1_Chr3-2g05961 [Microbotryum saponariae]
MLPKRAGVLSLLALTLHYSVLSIMLHVSRSMPGARYHASSAIALTEFFKIIVALALVAWSGELRPTVSERQRLYWQLDERRALAEASEPAWLGEEKGQSGGDESDKDDDQKHYDWLSMAETTCELSPSPELGLAAGVFIVDSSSSGVGKRGSPTTLRIDSCLAQQLDATAPKLALIPATPAPEPSPTKILDADGLYPTRQAFELRARGSHMSDVLDVEWWRALQETVWSEGWWNLAFVAALYMVQGNLQYVASGNLSVPLFQLAYQLKIPATAMCSVILLKRVLTQQQWASLFVLTFGVGIVQIYSVSASTAASTQATPLAPAHESGRPNQFIGLLAVMAACISSGFASCFFEQILKTPSTPHSSPNPNTTPTTFIRPSIWVRNIQLSFFGLVAGVPVLMWELSNCAGDANGAVAASGWWRASAWQPIAAASTFFDGFNAITWMVVFLQVTGGLLGALVMKHADNLLKCFSTSMSILLSVVASVFLFNFQVNLGIVFGSAMVLAATYVYTTPTTREAWRWRPANASPRRHQNTAPSIIVNDPGSRASSHN